MYISTWLGLAENGKTDLIDTRITTRSKSFHAHSMQKERRPRRDWQAMGAVQLDQHQDVRIIPVAAQDA
jgi:hypothetical protein